MTTTPANAIVANATETPSVAPAVESATGPAVGLKASLWWMVFLAATVTLSLVFAAFKDFTLTPTLHTGLWLGIKCVALFGLTAALVYDGYAKEKQQGKVKNPVGWFDKVYALQTGTNESATVPQAPL